MLHSVEVGILSGVSDIIKLKLRSRVPSVLAIPSSGSASPLVSVLSISRCVLVIHVEPQALHGVSIQDVSKIEVVAKLRGVREVGAVVPALGPVHHQGVGSHIAPAPALGAPVGRGKAGGEVMQGEWSEPEI